MYDIAYYIAYELLVLLWCSIWIGPWQCSYMPYFAGGNTTLWHPPSPIGSVLNGAAPPGFGADTRPDAGNGSQLNFWLGCHGCATARAGIFDRLRWVHVYVTGVTGVTPRSPQNLLLERYTFPPAAMLHSSLVGSLQIHGWHYCRNFQSLRENSKRSIALNFAQTTWD